VLTTDGKAPRFTAGIYRRLCISRIQSVLNAAAQDTAHARNFDHDTTAREPIPPRRWSAAANRAFRFGGGGALINFCRRRRRGAARR